MLYGKVVLTSTLMRLSFIEFFPKKLEDPGQCFKR